MNILFTTSAAPEKSPFSTMEKRPPMGLGFLMALARRAGHTVLFVDNYLTPSGFPGNGYLRQRHVDVVAIYANTICYRDTRRMFEELEALRQTSLWDGKIIVGGPHTSVALETIPDFVDHVVQGEGERAFLDILDGKETARVIRGPRLDNLDALPFQPWDLFSQMPYDSGCHWMNTDSIFTMNTSRGCPFNCAFCSVRSVWGNRYVCQSAERVIAEMEYLIRDFGAKGFYFREDHFTLDLKRTEEFCKQLIRKGIRAPWACETRVDCITEDMVKLMASAGCAAVYLGVESGSQRVLDLVNKGISVRQIENAVKRCKTNDINVYCSLIVGIPGETFEDHLETRALMKRLKPYSYAFNVFVGIPTSPLYRQILQEQSHEYIDDVGLVYLPGFDIKTEAFYGRDSTDYVNHEFRKRTEFDNKLLPLMRWLNWKRKCCRFASILLRALKNMLRPARRTLARVAGELTIP